MPQTSLEYDEATEALIEELKKTFRVKSKAAVFKRALAIAHVLARNADETGAVEMRNPSEPDKAKTVLMKY